MIEVLMALTFVGALAGLAILVIAVPWLWLVWLASGALLFGFFVGVPAGFYYHVVLRRELMRLGKLEPRWWWRPHAFHEFLDADAKKRVLPWWFTGAGGFLVILFGFALCVLVLATGS